jgi:ABC-type polysaccharide/polyol phosphate export permease
VLLVLTFDLRPRHRCEPAGPDIAILHQSRFVNIESVDELSRDANYSGVRPVEQTDLIELIRSTHRYRQLIWALALKELKVRYKRSVLGFLWALLNPALMMVVLTIVFSTIMRFGIPHYAIFLLSVLLPWTFFSQSLSYAVESIVSNGELIKKVSVPKLVFPVAAVVSNVINLLLSLIPLALLVIGLGHPFYATWLYLPVPILALIIFTLGVTFLFAVANVYYRDVAHIVQVLLSAWFYFTPIIYALDFIPANRRWMFKLNPIIYVINGFRLSVYYGQLPRWTSIVGSFVCAFGALLIGFTVFRKYQDDSVFYV